MCLQLALSLKPMRFCFGAHDWVNIPDFAGVRIYLRKVGKCLPGVPGNRAVKETGDVPGLRERHLRLRIPKGVEILSHYPS
jgi:hypothetical protein